MSPTTDFQLYFCLLPDNGVNVSVLLPVSIQLSWPQSLCGDPGSRARSLALYKCICKIQAPLWHKHHIFLLIIRLSGETTPSQRKDIEIDVIQTLAASKWNTAFFRNKVAALDIYASIHCNISYAQWSLQCSSGNGDLRKFGSDPNKYIFCVSAQCFFKKENVTQWKKIKCVYFVGQTKLVLKKMTGACKKLLLWSSSKTITWMNAHGQEGISLVSLCIRCQFQSHWLRWEPVQKFCKLLFLIPAFWFVLFCKIMINFRK